MLQGRQSYVIWSNKNIDGCGEHKSSDVENLMKNAEFSKSGDGNGDRDTNGNLSQLTGKSLPSKLRGRTRARLISKILTE